MRDAPKTQRERQRQFSLSLSLSLFGIPKPSPQGGGTSHGARRLYGEANWLGRTDRGLSPLVSAHPPGGPHGQTESGGIELAVICWSPCAQRRCYPTGRYAYRPSVTFSLPIKLHSLSLSFILVPPQMLSRYFLRLCALYGACLMLKKC